MTPRVVLSLLAAVALCLPAAAQSPQEYIDVMISKVKPEKRGEFDQLVGRMAATNRKNNGDMWLAAETVYGEGNTIYFISTRTSYADVEKAFDVFMGAMAKGLGEAGVAKIFQDFSNCVTSMRSELRRRRPDLSINMPADSEGRLKEVGKSHWYRTVTMRIRPGRVGEYEDLLKTIKAAREQKTPQFRTWVSQSVAGQVGNAYHLTSLQESLAGFDQAGPPLREVLGEEGYQKYQKINQEAVIGSETVINRFLPALSNPVPAVSAVDPAYWNPKPPAGKPAAAAKKQ